MTNELVLKTINCAVDKYKPSNLIIHTDLGSQYTSNDFESRLKELKIKHSFSHKGCPYDNAGIESFHATLKKMFTHKKKSIKILNQLKYSFSNILKAFTIVAGFMEPLILLHQMKQNNKLYRGSI